MTLSYRWSVRRMLVRQQALRVQSDVQNASDAAQALQAVVVHVVWEKLGVDAEGRCGRFFGATPLSRDGSVEPFIAWEQLTEAQVLAWVQQKVIGSYAQHVDNVIAREIAQQLEPLTDAGLPWGGAQPPLTVSEER